MGRIIILAWLSILCANQLIAGIDETALRTKGISVAQSYVGRAEATGKNDGKAIKIFQDCVHIKSGEPWCAGFPCVVYQDIGYDAKMNGRAISCCEDEYIINPADAKPLDLFYYYSHTGIIENWPVRGEYVYTIEGNHSNKVANVRRKKKELTKVANVLKHQLKEKKKATTLIKQEVKPYTPAVNTEEPTKKTTNYKLYVIGILLILIIFK